MFQEGGLIESNLLPLSRRELGHPRIGKWRLSPSEGQIKSMFSFLPKRRRFEGASEPFDDEDLM